MIARIWHGYTTPENADAYQQVLAGHVIPAIAARPIAGYHGIQVFRRPLGGEVEFVTIMTFDAIENVSAFAGDDYERAHVPDAARAVLKRFDERAQHSHVLSVAPASYGSVH